MKLYGTITSERATKGQGGNSYLDILVNDEKKENICRLYVENRDDEIYVELNNYSNGEKHIFSKEKGEKQKGDLCINCGKYLQYNVPEKGIVNSWCKPCIDNIPF